MLGVAPGLGLGVRGEQRGFLFFLLRPFHLPGPKPACPCWRVIWSKEAWELPPSSCRTLLAPVGLGSPAIVLIYGGGLAVDGPVVEIEQRK